MTAHRQVGTKLRRPPLHCFKLTVRVNYNLVTFELELQRSRVPPGMKLVCLQSCHTRGGLNLKSTTSDHYGKLSVVRPAAPNQTTCVSSMRPACICQAISAGRGDNDSNEQDARTIHALETIIDQRRQELTTSNECDVGGVGTSKSWTAKLLSNPSLLREKIREEAGELCDTQEHGEGRERTASEMADLLYHSLVLLNNQGVKFHEVAEVLRMRFGTSGIEEKASRPAKAADPAGSSS